MPRLDVAGVLSCEIGRARQNSAQLRQAKMNICAVTTAKSGAKASGCGGGPAADGLFCAQVYKCQSPGDPWTRLRVARPVPPLRSLPGGATSARPGLSPDLNPDPSSVTYTRRYYSQLRARLSCVRAYKIATVIKTPLWAVVFSNAPFHQFSIWHLATR